MYYNIHNYKAVIQKGSKNIAILYLIAKFLNPFPNRTSNRVLAGPNRVLAGPNRVPAAPNRVLAGPNRVLAAPNRVLAAPNRVLAAPNRVLAASNRVPDLFNLIFQPFKQLMVTVKICLIHQ